MTDDSYATRTSLLIAACDPQDQHAWQAFADRYEPLIRGWIKARGAQEEDAADVSQAVLLKLVAAMGRYDRDKGRFRSWLRRVASNCWLDALRQRQRQLPARLRELSDDFGALVVQSDEEEVLDHAMAQLPERVRTQSWQAFRQLKYERRPASEVAAELGLTVEAVYQAAYRVKQALASAYASREH